MNGLKDTRINSITRLPAPDSLRKRFPLTDLEQMRVVKSRETINQILCGVDNRLMVIVGPCSIHDFDEALVYARRLKKLAAQVSRQLYLVMRVYVEKPRTGDGWKGFAYAPDILKSNQRKGLIQSRRLMAEIVKLDLPIAVEFLSTIAPQYLMDCVSWVAIGARTTESALHRELASGLYCAVGFKNATSGSVEVAINSILSARCQHTFLGIDEVGCAAEVGTAGNPHCGLVLRGGNDGPNYDCDSIARAMSSLEKKGINRRVIIDASHGNSGKNFRNQPSVIDDVIAQIEEGSRNICGVMIESNINEGSQTIPDDLSLLMPGVSITDSCLGWPETEQLLFAMAARLKKTGQTSGDAMPSAINI